VERAALIPAFSRREKENRLRGFGRVEPGVGQLRRGWKEGTREEP
jgi:hypothetical protein